MADRAPDRLVWVDCEMTGLDLGKDQLVEIAVIVTESDLTELDSGLNIIIRPADMSVLDSMDEVVREMHTTSGLLEEIPNGVTLAEAEEKVLDYVRQHVPDSRKAPL
ncbi:MAG: oligoribonuclease, partial [Actinomycetales bacterium mxb001]